MNTKLILSCILGLSMFSCSNSKTNSGDNSASSETEYENMSPILTPFKDMVEGLSIIPFTDRTVVGDMRILMGMILIDKNGQAPLFNNDASYLSGCPLVYFIDRVHYYCSWYNYWDSYSDEQYLQFIPTMITGIVDYLNGNKDKITDRELFKIIDRAYYDFHPERIEFYNKESRYGRKTYSNNRDDYCVSFKSYNPEVYNFGLCPINPKDIPEGILIMSVGRSW
ncbi:MAG: hypothetical protein K2J06_09465 [Muribaculaceae bacterium]|nr:hypothetical protein [Muribaculaceae bacterium]